MGRAYNQPSAKSRKGRYGPDKTRHGRTKEQHPEINQKKFDAKKKTTKK